MALRVLLQLIDESFTSSIKTLKWDINSGKVMGLSPILERASVLTGIFCSKLSNLSEQFCESGEVLVADGSIRERGSPNADRSAFRKLTPEHEAAIKTFIDYRNSSQGAGKVRLFHHVTYIEPPCLCVLPFAPPPFPPLSRSPSPSPLSLTPPPHLFSQVTTCGDNCSHASGVGGGRGFGGGLVGGRGRSKLACLIRSAMVAKELRGRWVRSLEPRAEQRAP